MKQSLFLYYYLLIIIFHTNNSKPTFALPCILKIQYEPDETQEFMLFVPVIYQSQ